MTGRDSIASLQNDRGDVSGVRIVGMNRTEIMDSKGARTELLGEVKKRKEKFISENAKYRNWEGMYHRHTTGKYLGDLIYGANDGIITTFAVVAGAVGASFSPVVIIILGFANIFADGISMGASNYLSLRSEQDYAQAQRQKEEWEVDNLRAIEVDEIREIFEKKGFIGKDLDRAVEIITSDRNVWVDTMMRDELGILEDKNDNPIMHGGVTFSAFLIAGIVPLFAYLVPGVPNVFGVAVVMCMISLFVVGALRSLVTAVSWFRGGMEMLLVGVGAASVAFFVGRLLENFVRQ